MPLKSSLKMADDLALPLETAPTQTYAFIARKGAGKTYAAGKLVELFLAAGVQVVILDTVGNWYGLRLGADGKAGGGFDVPVLGGLRGDIPLEAHGGALVADLVVDTGRSLILDMSQFSLADRKRFAVTFGERLWQRRKGEADPAPVHVVIEESQLIVPQFTGRGGDDGRMVGIFEEIIRLGRNYGIGVSMITQRPQSVNKEVLNQTECLFVGQVNGAQERDALKKWIVHQGMDAHLVDQLPSLKIGTFYVWSPQWLQLLERIAILPKVTYDASATPKLGTKRAQRELKPLDLSELQQKMSATIERAKAEDPKELGKKIAELEREVRTAKAAPPAAAPAAPVEILTEHDREQLAKLLGLVAEVDLRLTRFAAAQMDALTTKLAILLETARAAAVDNAAVGASALKTIADRAGFRTVVEKMVSVAAQAPKVVIPQNRPEIARPEKKPNENARSARGVDSASHSGLSGGQRNILDVLAMLEVRLVARSLESLTAWLDLHPNGGTFRGNLKVLRDAGLLEDFELTANGRAAARALETGLAAAKARLTGGQVTIVERLEQEEAAAIPIETLAERLGLHPNGGTFRGNVSRLRKMGLITSGHMKLTEAAYR